MSIMVSGSRQPHGSQRSSVILLQAAPRLIGLLFHGTSYIAYHLPVETCFCEIHQQQALQAVRGLPRSDEAPISVCLSALYTFQPVKQNSLNILTTLLNYYSYYHKGCQK